MRGMRFGFVLSLAACAASAALHAATLEEIKKGMEATKDAYTSLSYTEAFVTVTKTPELSQKVTGSRAVELKKQGELWLLRSEGESTTLQTLKGKTIETKEKVLTIRDVEWWYTLNEMKGKQWANKAKVDKERVPITNNLEPYLEGFDLKALPDEVIEGQACFVVEAVAKYQAQPGGKMTLWFAKSCGVMMKMVGDAQNEGTTTMTITNLKINPTIGDDRFVFKAPEGVIVKGESPPEKENPQDK